MVGGRAIVRVFARVEEHVSERIAGLARCLQCVRVEAIAEDGATAFLVLVERTRDADFEPSRNPSRSRPACKAARTTRKRDPMRKFGIIETTPKVGYFFARAPKAA